LLQCTIGVSEWQTVGIGAFRQGLPDRAAGGSAGAKVIVLAGRLFYPVTLENFSH
jgi:hypothetical protein